MSDSSDPRFRRRFLGGQVPRATSHRKPPSPACCAWLTASPISVVCAPRLASSRGGANASRVRWLLRPHQREAAWPPPRTCAHSSEPRSHREYATYAISAQSGKRGSACAHGLGRSCGRQLRRRERRDRRDFALGLFVKAAAALDTDQQLLVEHGKDALEHREGWQVLAALKLGDEGV